MTEAYSHWLGAALLDLVGLDQGLEVLAIVKAQYLGSQIWLNINFLVIPVMIMVMSM